MTESPALQTPDFFVFVSNSIAVSHKTFGILTVCFYNHCGSGGYYFMKKYICLLLVVVVAMTGVFAVQGDVASAFLS